MNKKSLVSLKSYLPPRGTALFTIGDNPIVRASHDLCKIVLFLQQHRPEAKLIQLADWWQHDGLCFEQSALDFRRLIQIVEKPRHLVENMPGDDLVFVGVGVDDRSWYLRFLVDWDDSDENLLARFSITMDNSLAPRFELNVLPTLECPTDSEESTTYFDRIEASPRSQ